MTNSNGGKQQKIDAIYKVRRAEEDISFGHSIKGDLNRKLLWHGSKAANLLSILQKVLKHNE